MENIGGMKPTGRRVAGPAADLVELESNKGLKHTAIVFHPEYRDNPVLNSDLHEIRAFLEAPGVDGLVPLVDYDPVTGAFLYPTGTIWSVAEVVRTFAEQGRAPGVRAGLELCYLAGQILLEAASEGAEQGAWSHAGLTPWRVVLKPDGQVHIIGYGLPQVEIHEHVADESRVPREDSFRYAPPERLDGAEEDFTSDLFALALITFEVITGKPVYDGLLDDIRQQAVRGEGQRRLYQWRDRLPRGVQEVLGRCLKFDPDARYQDGADFVYAVHEILSSPDAEGPGLMDVMREVRAAQKQQEVVVGGRTAMLSKEELAALAEDIDGPTGPRELPPPRMERPEAEAEESPPEEEVPEDQPRWGKVSRRARRRGEEPAAGGRTLQRSSDEERPRRVRRSSDEDRGRRLRRSSDEDRSRRLRRSEGDGRAVRRSEDALPDRPRRRRAEGEEVDARPRRVRRAEAEETPAPAEAPKPQPSGRSDGGRAQALLQRLRSSTGGDVAPPPDEVTEPTGAPPAPEPEVREPTPAPAEPQRAAESPATPPTPKPVEAEPAAAVQPEVQAPAAKTEAPAAETEAPAAKTEAPAAKTEAPVARVEEVEVPPMEPGYFQVSVDGGAPRKIKFKLNASLAESTYRLIEVLGAMPTDLTGHITGWYRIEQQGRPLPGSKTAEDLDPRRVVHLRYVPNRVVPVTFQVQGLPDEIRFQAPVGTAVLVRSLVEHLRRWLQLPEGAWSLQAAGERLEPMQILEDLEPDADLVLVVSR